MNVIKPAIIGIILLVSYFSPMAAAEVTWNYVSGSRDWKVGNELECDGYKIEYRDCAKNDDGRITQIIIDIKKGDNKDTQIISSGCYYEFEDEKHKFHFVSARKNRINVATYALAYPEFDVSMSTKRFTTGSNYEYESAIKIKCIKSNAENVKVSFDSVDCDGNYKNKNLGLIKIDDDETINIKYDVNAGEPDLIMEIDYEDEDGNDYIQKFDILNDEGIIEVSEDYIRKTDSGIRVITRYTQEDRYKLSFSRDIEIALNRIDFNESDSKYLTELMNRLNEEAEG